MQIQLNWTQLVFNEVVFTIRICMAVRFLTGGTYCFWECTSQDKMTWVPVTKCKYLNGSSTIKLSLHMDNCILLAATLYEFYLFTVLTSYIIIMLIIQLTTFLSHIQRFMSSLFPSLLCPTSQLMEHYSK